MFLIDPVFNSEKQIYWKGSVKKNRFRHFLDRRVIFNVLMCKSKLYKKTEFCKTLAHKKDRGRLACYETIIEVPKIISLK